MFTVLHLFLLPFVVQKVVSKPIDPDVHELYHKEPHWEHITIRRLIEQRIHKTSIKYRTPDTTEHGHAVRREWGSLVDAKDLDALGRKVCTHTTCRHGQCVFAGCSNPTFCNGGKCTFVDCAKPSCAGGKCRFIGCHDPTCSGGMCRFELTNTTLKTGYCKGGACLIDDVPTANNMQNTLAE